MTAAAAPTQGVSGGIVHIDEINPAPYNPRKDLKPTDPAYQTLKKAIEHFGLVEPLVWNTRTGNLVGGHQRLKVLKELGRTHIPVTIVDLSDSDEMALNVALNKIGGEWDIPKLKELLVELDAGDIDLTLTGFNEGDLKNLVDFEGKAGLTDPNAVPAEAPAITKPGNLWILGDHRLLCGDSTKMNSVQAVLKGVRPCLVVTDPPYGVDYVGKTKDALTIKNDGSEGLLALLTDTFTHLSHVLDDGAAVYVCHPAGKLSAVFAAVFASTFRLHETLVWVKDSMVLGHSDYHYRHEPILFGYKAGGGRRGRGGEGWYGDNAQTSVLEVPRPKASEQHPTMKPVELLEIMIRNSSPVGGDVLDPFLGSGSTLLACEKAGRRCFGLELDPKYCDVIVKRWEDFTGRKAEIGE